MARKKAAFRKARKQNRISVFLILFVMTVFIIVIGVTERGLRVKQKAYQQQEQELQEKIDKEKARAQELEEYAKYTQTQKFKEDVAKEKLGLVHENEIVFKEE